MRIADPWGTERGPGGPAPGRAADHLPLLVAAAREVAARSGLSPHPPWLPPCPPASGRTTSTGSTSPTTRRATRRACSRRATARRARTWGAPAADGRGVDGRGVDGGAEPSRGPRAGAGGAPRRPRAALALGDLPSLQRRTVVRWDPRDGHLAVQGRARSGRTTALRTVGRAALEARLVGPRDRVGARRPRGAPGTGTVVDRSDPRRVVRLLRLLAGHDDGQPRPAGLDRTTGRTLLLVDDVEVVRGVLAGVAGGRAPTPSRTCSPTPRRGRGERERADGRRAGVARRRPGGLASRDRHDDVSLGVPAALAGQGGPPGRAVWLGPGDPLVCQVAVPPEGSRGWTELLRRPAGARSGCTRCPTTSRPPASTSPDARPPASTGSRRGRRGRGPHGRLGRRRRRGRCARPGTHRRPGRPGRRRRPDAVDGRRARRTRGRSARLRPHEHARAPRPPRGSHRFAPRDRHRDDALAGTAVPGPGRIARTTGRTGAGRWTTTARGTGTGTERDDRRAAVRARGRRSAPRHAGGGPSRRGVLGRATAPEVVVVDDLDVLTQLCVLEAERLAALCRDGLVLLASATTGAAASALRGPLADLRGRAAASSSRRGSAGAPRCSGTGWSGSPNLVGPDRVEGCWSRARGWRRSRSPARDGRAAARCPPVRGEPPGPRAESQAAGRTSRVVASTTGRSMRRTSTMTASTSATTTHGVTPTWSELTATTPGGSATSRRATVPSAARAAARGGSRRARPHAEREDDEEDAHPERLRPTTDELDEDQHRAHHERGDLDAHPGDERRQRGRPRPRRTTVPGRRAGLGRGSGGLAGGHDHPAYAATCGFTPV